MRYDYEGKMFSAFDPDGRGYLLAPVYRFRVGTTGRTYDAGDCVGLLTEDGRWVRRDRKGLYAILGTEHVHEVRLTSRVEGAV
ncbi:MAG: hypothetical protein WBC44_10515 [Planctomycetaceae bacterium]